MLRKERGGPPGARHPARRLAAVALAALVLSFLSFAASSSLPSQAIDRSPLREHVEAAAKRAHFQAAARARALTGAVPPSVEGTDRGLDVLSYDIFFDVDPAIRYLSGTTVIRVAGFAPRTTSLALDLDDAFTVTASMRDGLDVTATRMGGKLVIPFEPPLGATDRATLSISYRGVPPAASALDFRLHPGGWAATSVAEPFLARTFWPCVDDPKDKAVATVHATVPPGYVMASAGTASVADAGGGRNTYTWKLPQTISTYLVSLNVANYVTVEDTYTALDGRKMPIRSYLLPENAAANIPRLSEIKNHIAVLASLFGEYPFVDTKYGIVSSWFSGGMEHPTLTSIGENILSDVSRNITLLLVHELAHQWWGDKVTMRTWDDVWLNEGFATYSEVLYQEKAQGRDPGPTLRATYDDGLYGGRLWQSVVADPADPFKYTGAVYHKGAWFLHMLRRLVGDDAFFSGLRAYGNAHAWGTATRGELRALFEQRTGLDLKQFWDQWLETPFRPTFRATYRTSADASTVTLTVTQTQGHTVVHPAAGPDDRPYYVFPLVVRLTYLDGTTSDATVVPTGVMTTVTVPNPSRKFVAGIALDPGSDILKIVESIGPG